MASIKDMKKEYYSKLDEKAKQYAELSKQGKPFTSLLLEDVHSLYMSAKVEKDFKDSRFDCAYHNPITSEFEFLVSRIIYRAYPDISIYLRRQVNGTAPDIRMERSGKTIAIIEIKAKAGWMQAFFSKEREAKYLKKLAQGKTDKDPRKQIAEIRGQLLKYSAKFGIGKDRIFMILPTFALVHRKKSQRTMADYLADFETNSTLSKDNLLIMSNNLRLDLGKEKIDAAQINPTDRMENFLTGLKNLK